MLPQPLNGIEFWTVRRLKQQNDVLRDNQILTFVKSSVIDLENVQTVRESLREFIQESLVAIGIHMGELQKQRSSGSRFNGSIEPESFEQPLPLSKGFDATGSNHSSHPGVQPKSTFILGKVADGAWVLASFAGVQAQHTEVGGKVCSKAALASRFCLQCCGRATFSLAFSR